MKIILNLLRGNSVLNTVDKKDYKERIKTIED